MGCHCLLRGIQEDLAKKTEGGECKESIEGTLRKVFQLSGVSSAVKTAKSSSEMWTEDLPLALIMCKSW